MSIVELIFGETDLNNYINPELLIGVPFLIFIGKILKGIVNGKRKYIPAILGMLGVIFATAWTLFSPNIENLGHAVLSGIVQGVLLAGTAVYGYEIFKNFKKGNQNND
jgi:hypothetical protein